MFYQNERRKHRQLKYLLASLLVVAVAISTWFAFGVKNPVSNVASSQNTPAQTTTNQVTYQPSAEEQAYLKERFDALSAINPEVIGYIYAPGTKLDEPVVQTGDNATYLDKTFEGNNEPLMGAVFMDTDNNKDWNDSLTWLFGHARGSQVPDNRMFNDVNFYEDQTFFDQNRYLVLETAERKYYYEAMFFIIVPETTAFYRTSFDSEESFAEQLNAVATDAVSKKEGAVVKPTDKYLVLSTCREDDDTIRSNLYMRRIPDSELEQFLAENGDKLTYVPTR
ncbi:class B sortase, LPKTxAVK-specific [Streptococcus sp. sy010]|uniref:class B sortase, LPKTxAVK-specific n=1 Tax=Streptococcus sp. sy010 TaxID=2600148 RepID=UPI0011B3B9AF|nr:class B sortase, LPKTxAVK-specific [Streptococcus sp. sy010]TWT16220.1 class B sortase [Streptococcus sp. sy010]